MYFTLVLQNLTQVIHHLMLTVSMIMFCILKPCMDGTQFQFPLAFQEWDRSHNFTTISAYYSQSYMNSEFQSISGYVLYL